jgi:putative methyltransferase (TIGR04325 family)
MSLLHTTRLYDACLPLLRRLDRFETLRTLRELDHQRRVTGNLFRGIYRTFAEALAEVDSPSRMVGYDHDALGAIYRERTQHVYPADYPVLYWMSKPFREKPRVFDFGGHIGIAYYAYRSHLGYPADVDWKVLDVPAVLRAGEDYARTRESTGLSFTDDFTKASGYHLLMSAGALQYVEQPFSQMLAGLVEPPPHLVLNKLPLFDGETFVTVQDTGMSLHPYWIFSREEFIGSITRMGYTLVDSWENREHSCNVPGSDRPVLYYTGLYLRRE